MRPGEGIQLPQVLQLLWPISLTPKPELLMLLQKELNMIQGLGGVRGSFVALSCLKMKHTARESASGNTWGLC